MEPSVVSVSNLTKRFGNFTAVDDVSFEINKGEILGLLGPNGAGKTTTINILLGLTKRTSGEIKIFGMDIEKERSKILKRASYASTYSHFQSLLSVFENLLVYCFLYEVPDKKKRILDVLDDLEIMRLKDKKFGSLSSGEMTRAVLAKALLNKPELMLLDEPTASLDPDISEKVQDLLLRIKSKYKVAILYTSHNMHEVTKMCDRIVFLKQGKVIASDTPFNLTKKIEKCQLSLVFEGEKRTVEEVFGKKRWKADFSEEHKVLVSIEEEDIPAVLILLSGGGVRILEMDVIKPSLEDVFRLFVRDDKSI